MTEAEKEEKKQREEKDWKQSPLIEYLESLK
jgi:hypothetical protein